MEDQTQPTTRENRFPLISPGGKCEECGGPCSKKRTHCIVCRPDTFTSRHRINLATTAALAKVKLPGPVRKLVDRYVATLKGSGRTLRYLKVRRNHLVRMIDMVLRGGTTPVAAARAADLQAALDKLRDEGASPKTSNSYRDGWLAWLRWLAADGMSDVPTAEHEAVPALKGAPHRPRRELETRPCENCGVETTNPKYCGKSCSAQRTNRESPKREPEGKCPGCGAPCMKHMAACAACRPALYKPRAKMMYAAKAAVAAMKLPDAIQELVDRYLAAQAASANTPRHIDNTRHRLRRMVALVLRGGAVAIADAKPTDLRIALGTLREEGRSTRTCNSYRRTWLSWLNFLAGDGMKDVPLATHRHVKGFRLDVDPRHSRRALTVEELGRLFIAAERGPVIRGMLPRHRAMFYRTAAYTGLRASELRSLAVRDVKFEASPVVITLHARNEKARRGARQIVPEHVASLLREFVAGREPDARLFDVPRDGTRLVNMFRTDLKAAGILYQGAPESEGGRYADFHALRHTYITMLANNPAVPLRVAQEMARHSTVTLTEKYAHVDKVQMVNAANLLPPPPPPGGDQPPPAAPTPAPTPPPPPAPPTAAAAEIPAADEAIAAAAPGPRPTTPTKKGGRRAA